MYKHMFMGHNKIMFTTKFIPMLYYAMMLLFDTKYFNVENTCNNSINIFQVYTLVTQNFNCMKK